MLFDYPALQKNLSAEELAKFQPGLKRCQHIMDEWDHILEETREGNKRWMEEHGVDDGASDEKLEEEDILLLREKLKKKFMEALEEDRLEKRRKKKLRRCL